MICLMLHCFWRFFSEMKFYFFYVLTLTMCLATAKLFVSLFHIFFLFLFCILFTTKYHFSRCLFIFFRFQSERGIWVAILLPIFIEFCVCLLILLTFLCCFLLLLFLWIQNWNFFALFFSHSDREAKQSIRPPPSIAR